MLNLFRTKRQTTGENDVFNIQKFLTRMNWSQYDLAKNMKVTRSKVSGWCAGYRYPDYENIINLFRQGMTLEEAFGEEIEKLILKNQPSLDVSKLSPEDCRRIVTTALGTLAGSDAAPKK